MILGIGDGNVCDPSQRCEKVFFSERIIDRPPRLDQSMRTRTTKRFIFHSAETKLAVGTTKRISFRFDILLGLPAKAPSALTERHSSHEQKNQPRKPEFEREFHDT